MNAAQGAKSRPGGGAAKAKAGGGDGGGADAAARPFKIPEGYFESYLDGGKPKDEPEPDYPSIRAAGQSAQLADEHGAGFEKAYGAWLFEALRLEQFLGEHSKLAPMEARRPLLVELSALAPADRRMLRKHATAHGADERLTLALGPEGLSYLADAPPPPPDEARRDEKQEKAGERPPEEDKEKDKEKENEEKDKPENKDNFEGGTLFDKLFGAVLERKSAPAPDPILAQVAALDEQAWRELALVISEKQGWQILMQTLGPPFQQAIARLRFAPLARLMGAHPDGLCPPEERAPILSALEALGPFEKPHLVTHIVDGGHARTLLTLLGAELGRWLGGEFAGAPPPPPPKDPLPEPPAALAALRHLPPPLLRRVLDELRKQAAGPALAGALGDQLTAFVEGYFDSVAKPDPQQKREPKPALEALRQVDPVELKRMIPDGDASEGQNQEPAELAPDAGATQFEALFKPLLAKLPRPDQIEKTLGALERMSLREIEALLGEVKPDDRPRLEATLGPRLRTLVSDKLYAPLDEALTTHPLDEELPADVRAKLLEPLYQLSDFARACLEQRIVEEKSAEPLAALLGEKLAETKLQIDASVKPPPPPELLVVLATPERKSALSALKKLTPVNFASLLAACKPETLFRFATTCAEGLDAELGQALLKLVQPVELPPPDPQRAPVEKIELRAFFDALTAQGKAQAGEPLPRPNLAPAKSSKKKKSEEDDVYDGADVETIYRRILGKFLETGDEEKEIGDQEKAQAVSELLALPARVRRGLVQLMEKEGTWETLSAQLGPELGKVEDE